MGQTLRTAQGFDRTWRATLENGGVVTPYPPEAAFDAAVWPGEGEPTLFAPAAAWIDPAAGTFTLAVRGAQTAGLDPAVYRLQVGVTAGGVRSLAFDGHLEVLEAPGSRHLRAPYVTGRDLLYWYDQLGTLQTVRGGDAAFLEQRCEASDEFDLDLRRRYAPTRGLVRVRGGTLDPHLDTFDRPDPTAVPPTNEELADAVAAGGVIADRNVREMVSKLAVARVLDRQETMGGRNAYREEAMHFRADVERLWRKYDIPVDTSIPLDGVADLLVGRNVILLPAGTAP